MTASLLSILGILVSLLAIAARVFFYLKGKDSAKLKRAEKTLDDIQKGNVAAADSSVDDKLREKYGKK